MFFLLSGCTLKFSWDFPKLLLLIIFFQNLAHDQHVLQQGLLQLSDVLHTLRPLYTSRSMGGLCSVLLQELVRAPSLENAFSTPSATPLLHAMTAAHGYVIMFVHVCRTGQVSILS